MKDIFKGCMVAIITPFNEDNTINYQKFQNLIEWHISQSTDGIVVAGTTGEGTTLSIDEKIELFNVAIKCANKRIVIVTNCGSNDSNEALFLAQKSKELGADGIMLINPFYNKTSNEGIYQHFALIAKNVDIPIMLYNVPGRTGTVIPFSVVERLVSEFSNIEAIKDAGGDINYSLKIIQLNKLNLLSGDDNSTVALICIGGKGLVSVTANLIPKDFAKMVKMALDGNFKDALNIQYKYLSLVNSMFIEPNPIPIKAIMNLVGHKVGGYRLPLTQISSSNLEILKSEVNKI